MKRFSPSILQVSTTGRSTRRPAPATLAVFWVAVTLVATAPPTHAQGPAPPPETNETNAPTNQEWLARYYDSTEPINGVIGQTNPVSSYQRTPAGRVQPGEVITFDASGSFARHNQFYGGTSILNWVWDFGDGNQANGAIVTHAYDSPGVYHVGLAVHDDTGWRSSKLRTVEAGETPCGSSSQELWIPTGDGLLMHGWLAVPPGPGPFPAVLEYGPYAPFIVDACDDFVRSGYARANVAAPGRDKSTGSFDLFGPQTQRGGYDAVEWLASQTWSDGKVAMIGVSGPACAALLTAAAQPPHLAAVVAKTAYADLYRDMVYAGGVPNSNTFVTAWLALILGQDAAISFGGLGPNQEVLDRTADTARLLAEIQLHPTYDDWWRARSIVDQEAPDLPILYYGYQRDLWPRAAVELADWVAPGGGRIISTPGGHGVPDISGWEGSTSQPFDLLSGEARPWLDRFLKATPNGVEERPRVLTFTTYGGDVAAAFDHGRWEQLEGFPSALTEPKRLFLRAGGSDPTHPTFHGLDSNPPGAFEPPAVLPYVPLQGATSDDTGATLPQTAGLQEPWELGALVYETPLLAEALRVNGPATLSFHAALATPDAALTAWVHDVWTDGSAHAISKGSLLATHRALDDDRALYLGHGDERVLIRPYHPHTGDAVETLVPGTIYRFEVEIWGIHNAFQPGHRLRLALGAQDLGWRTTPVTGAGLVFNDAAHTSALHLATLPLERSHEPFPLRTP